MVFMPGTDDPVFVDFPMDFPRYKIEALDPEFLPDIRNPAGVLQDPELPDDFMVENG